MRLYLSGLSRMQRWMLYRFKLVSGGRPGQCQHRLHIPFEIEEIDRAARYTPLLWIGGSSHYTAYPILLV